MYGWKYKEEKRKKWVQPWHVKNNKNSGQHRKSLKMV